MTESKKPGKTLTLKKKPATSVATDDNTRKRSGARARQVAQLQRERQQTDEAPAAQARPRADKPWADKSRAAKPLANKPPTRKPRTDKPLVDNTNQDEQPRVTVRPRTEHRAPALSGRLTEVFHVFTPCPHGLEDALELELQALGFDDATADRAGCRLSTNWTGIQRINLYSRLATRVLVQVSQARIHNEDDILALAQDTPWERWFGAEQTLRVDTSAIRSPMKSLQYCNLRAKDGICDRLRDREGERPSIDTVRPDARVHLFLTEDTATLYLDTTGESLFKRGWRLDKGEAPIRENLAAGLLALSAWDPAQALLDPFCGSGTILIEAAWIALGVPPGIWRPFGFERLRNHDARHWRDLKDDARSHIATRLDAPLMGVDLDPAAIEASKHNIERAWLTPDSIRFEVGDARTTPAPASQGWIVTNPPYGERLPGDEPELWREWSQNLKRHYSGWQVHVISSDLELPQRMRLKPRRRYPLHNGPLDCRLFSFEMVEAGYRRPDRADDID